MKKSVLIAVLILILGVIGFLLYKAPSADKKTGLTKVRVQAGWVLNGEFASFCSAKLNGYYEAEGLDVELIPGGPSGASFIIATNAVAQDSSLDIAVDGDIVPLVRGVTKENENERLKVKAFASFWSEVPYGFIVREDSGLTSLKDLALKRKPDGSKYRIGVTSDSVIQNAIANYAGVNVSDLNLVTVGFDATPFLTDQVDALAAYWTTQAYEVEKAGVKYRFLPSKELPGFDQPSQVAIASEKTLKEKPEVLSKWLKASFKGQEFVKNNPEEAAKQILDSRCGGPTFDLAQETWLIKKSIPLFTNINNALNGDEMVSFAKAYYDLKQIPRVPSASELIDSSILKKAK